MIDDLYFPEEKQIKYLQSVNNQTVGHITSETVRCLLEDHLTLQSALAEARRQLELIQSQRKAAMETEKADASKALHALAGAHICTPVEGYGSNSSWAISDLCRAVKDLKLERDDAQRRLEEKNKDNQDVFDALTNKRNDLALVRKQLAASQQRDRVLESDSELLSQIIDISNHGEPLLDESIWDDLPGDSEDVQEEMRAALRKRVAAQASAEGRQNELRCRQTAMREFQPAY